MPKQPKRKYHYHLITTSVSIHGGRLKLGVSIKANDEKHFIQMLLETYSFMMFMKPKLYRESQKVKAYLYQWENGSNGKNRGKKIATLDFKEIWNRYVSYEHRVIIQQPQILNAYAPGAYDCADELWVIECHHTS